MNIEALYEEELNIIKGFWTEGHQDIKNFIDCAEIEFDIEDKPIDPLNVVHGWGRKITDKEIVGDFDYYMGFSKKPSNDVQKTTYFFYYPPH